MVYVTFVLYLGVGLISSGLFGGNVVLAMGIGGCICMVCGAIFGVVSVMEVRKKRKVRKEENNG